MYNQQFNNEEYKIIFKNNESKWNMTKEKIKYYALNILCVHIYKFIDMQLFLFLHFLYKI